jgi:hypothetical protein
MLPEPMIATLCFMIACVDVAEPWPPGACAIGWRNADPRLPGMAAWIERTLSYADEEVGK